MSKTIKKYAYTATKGELRELFFEGNEKFELIEEGGWEDEGKCQYATNIFKDKDGVFWSMNGCKSGSYFSDYEYMIDDYLTQVERKEIVVKKWVRVKKR